MLKKCVEIIKMVKKRGFNNLKKNFLSFLTQNIQNPTIKKKAMNVFVQVLWHEYIHYMIFQRFNVNATINIDYYLVKDRQGVEYWMYSASCPGFCSYPHTPKKFPLYIIILFINFIFDLIDRISRFKIYEIFVEIKEFLLNLFNNPFLKLKKYFKKH